MKGAPLKGLIPRSKPCASCGRVKALAYFGSDVFAPDGKRSKCSWCYKVRAWRNAGVLGDLPDEPPECCAICGVKTLALHMDHCHRTGYFRGFLCRGCNFGVGHLKDDAVVVRRAAEYLDKAEQRIAQCTDL